MKLFEDLYLDFLHIYKLAGLSYILFMIFVIFTPVLFALLGIASTGFITGKIQRRIRGLVRFVHIHVEIRRRKLHPAVLIKFKNRLAIIRTLF